MRLVIMLAYSIIHALADHWRALDLTVEESLDQLATVCRDPSRYPTTSRPP